MTSTLNSPGKELLLQAINRVNDHQFTFEQIDFDAPSVTTEYGRNTKVIMKALPSFTHCGEVAFFYYRLDLTELFKRTCTGNATVNITGATTVGAIVAALNAKHALMIEQTDIIEPFDTPVDVGAGGTVKLTASPQSYAYIGHVLVTLGEGGLSLDIVIGDPLLDGLLYHPLNGGVADNDLQKVIGDPLLAGLKYVNVP